MITTSRRAWLLFIPAVGAASSYAAAPSEQVIITAPGTQSDFRVNAVDTIGPLGTAPLLDIPYSVTVLPQQIIQDSQATNFKEVSKYLPLVAFQEQQGPDILRPQTRGMQGSNFQNTKLDGMTMFITVANAVEQFQQIEVLNGLSASLYGPANPAGMFNFVSKRPTERPYYDVSASYISDSIGTVRADLSGGIDQNGVVKYRINALYGSGDGFVDLSHQRRLLGDIGVDVRAWSGGVVELNYSDYHLTNLGYPGWFTYNETRVLPSAPDPTRVGFGQSYAGVDLHNRIGTVRLRQEFAPNWHLVVGVLHQDARRDINTPVNNLTSDTGNFTSSFANGFAPRFVITSNVAYLNGNFETGSLTHDLMLGTAGYKAQTYSVRVPATPASVLLGKASIDNPMIFPEPPQGPPDTSDNFNSSNNYQQGINVGDTINFNARWAIRAIVSQDWFHTDNFSVQGTKISEYSNSGLSPSGSLIFKPARNMTTYFTYASSLQPGDLAPGTAANGGASLPPYRSKGYELGYKASFAKFEFTTALFRIERPFANIDPTDQVFKISGQQVNRGLEISGIGQMVDGLTMFGGLTLLDARMRNTPLPSTDGQIYVGAPKVKGNALFEYQMPFNRRLVAMFNYQFSGPRPANDTNTQEAAGYNLFDIGGRYTWMSSSPVTLRLAVNNVTNRQYWSTIGPSNLTGANTGNLLAHLGTPRTYLATLSVNF